MNRRLRLCRCLAVLCLPALSSGCTDQAANGASRAPDTRASKPVTFIDVTRDSGIDFVHVNGASGRFYYPETFGSGAAFLDFNGDGWLDIFFVNSDYWPDDVKMRPKRPKQALFQNDGTGRFKDVTAGSGLDVSMYGMGVSVADFDDDGRDDLYVTGLDRSILFRNESGMPSSGKTESAAPIFRDVTAETGVDNRGHWGTSSAWLDYDLDGKLDLFVCNYVQYGREDEQVCSQGGERVYCGPLVYTADSCRLYRNLGARRFHDVTDEAGIRKSTGKALGAAVWDMNGDRYPEILVANDLTPNYFFRNTGRGFQETALDSGIAYGGDGLARSGMGIDVADTRNDGRCSVFISNFAREPNSFFEMDSPFVFSDRSYESGMGEASLQYLGFGLFFFDLDNDGWKDAFVTDGHIQPSVAKFEPSQSFAQKPLLFHNRRDGTYDDVTSASGEGLQQEEVGRGAAWGDYDNDGDLDILLTSNNGPARLLRNENGNSAAWLKLAVRGSRSGRSGLGARVTVWAGGIVQRDQVRSGSSYLSSSDRRLHFGLGQAADIDQIEIAWPSGVTDTLKNVKANQILVVEEGSSAGKGSR